MDEKDHKINFCENSERVKRTKYLIETLGDVKLNKELYGLYINKFQSFGGRYSVRT